MNLPGYKKRILSVLLTTSALTGMAAGAYAQDLETEQTESEQTEIEQTETEQGDTTLLQQIVVGAGVPKVAIDTPQAVTVLDQEAIDDRQPTTIADIFQQIPGVTMIGSDRVSGQSFNIRGIGGLGSADESKIIVTVDGAVKFYEQYRVGSFFSEPELYKQVEVLRGPASSTLYGSGALGGVVNFMTKDASDFLTQDKPYAVRVKTGYDSNTAGLMTSLIGAVSLSEQTDLLVSGNFRRSKDYVTGDGSSISGSAFEAFSGLAKVTHRFGENEEQTLRLSYQRWQSDADDTDYSQTGSLGFGTVDRDIVDQTVVLSYENPAEANPFLDLKVNFSFSDTSVSQDDASSSIPSALFWDADYGYRTWTGRVENTFETKSGAFENYLTVGTQLSYQERIADSPSGAITFHPEGTDTKFGLYLQDEFTWNKLSVIPGARVDFVSLEPDSSITSASSSNDVAFSPKLAMLYRLTDMFSVFGSVAHTERVPTLDELFSTSSAASSYPGGRTVSLDLEKEISNSVEAGFTVSKLDTFTSNDALQLKTTGYYNHLKDMISTNPDTGLSTAVPYYVNIDRAKIYGVEVEASYDADYVFARMAMNYTHGYDTQTGETLSTIPAKTLDMTLGGRLPEYNVSFGWNALFATGMRTGSNTGPFGGYGVHDVFLDWKPDEGKLAGVEFRTSIENIFDKQYQNNLSGDEAKGRTFKASLAYTF